ncbi:sulfatase family protein [Arenibacter palladensis]|uniref:sulfatase family protein n=1 Tax=Arenibacter palladensis TaxID=237373 RepID=UPI0026E1FB71|nr:sulfatase [Arenibacter palladensis]MDO6602838.1 sulfatase [Arenibacter palladensis]
MNYLKLIFLFLFVNGIITCQSQNDSPPNIVVIFIDDMGYGDIAPFGSTMNSTPNLVQLAKEGMKLTSFYVASPVCTPSRASLMTGCYPQRVGLNQGSGHIVLFPGDKHGVNPDEITIAELLKKKNYATGCFGKWHLGDQPSFLPTNHGFDTFYGIPYSNDMWAGYEKWPFPDLPVMEDDKVKYLVKTMDDQANLAKRFTEEAIKFIKNNKDRPFFCYIPHAFVHWPRQATSDFMANASTPEEGQVEEIDWSVGQIMRTLKDLKLDKNTLVLFTSDNGPAAGLSAGPLRGKKGSAYEGGHKVPTIAWWPGRISAGSVCDELASTIDLLPTFAGLAEIELPKDRIIDGKDIWSLLSGQPDKKTPHDRFFYQQGGELAAVRAGDWKLFLNGELYNLRDDQSESNDVASNNPLIVQNLKKMLLNFADEITKNKRKVGVVENPRTLVPRPGVEGEEGYAPTLSLPRNGN